MSSGFIPTEQQKILAAVREVLLSDEFLMAFAKRFYEQPTPISIQPATPGWRESYQIIPDTKPWTDCTTGCDPKEPLNPADLIPPFESK